MENIRKAYAAAARVAQYSILRHPSRSMAETLRVIADRAEQFIEPDVYGRGELIESFELKLANMLGKPAALIRNTKTSQAGQHAHFVWKALHEGHYGSCEIMTLHRLLAKIVY
ncbi:hypothetical protein Ga0061064_1768 [Pseudidiomarina woesei]|uniref:Uncharacterized protein n=1 Tax=Pseudidiomarina woesei TaxID=1381080 RepID=A0A0K6H8K5_9GAMM|nr:hypothetical protein Ga0061064_1768 [Pseudidiomarina woesei]